MKRLLILTVALLSLCSLSAYAQKLSKEEKAAAAKLAYDAAVESLNGKTFVLVPASYYTAEGDMETNDDDAVFLSYEGEKAFSQGEIVCNNTNTNVADVTEYDVNVDKKGNVKVRMIVSGRMWRGTYNITMRNGSNVADVIYNPQTGATRKFQGPIVPAAGAKYTKRANPI